MPIFVHTGTGREFDVAETAAAGFRSNPDFTESLVTPEYLDRLATELAAITSDAPPLNATKDVWVAWAESHGHDTDGLTKAQLQELE